MASRCSLRLNGCAGLRRTSGWRWSGRRYRLAMAESARTLLNEAVRLHQGGAFKAAVPYYIHAVRQAEVEAKATGCPVDPDVLHASGVALAMSGKRQEAVEFLETALANGKARSGAVWSALALAYVELRQLGKAERCYQMACKLDPSSCANWTGYANLAAAGGAGLIAERRYDRALACPARDAEELIAQGMTRLRRGQWRQGWRAYEARYQTAMWAERNPHAAPLRSHPNLVHYTYWRRPSKGDRVLVVTEQGLGDAVQFARYLPDFRDTFGVEVALQAHNSLVDLLTGALPGVQVIGRKESVPDVTGWALLLSLPAILRCADARRVPPAIKPFGLTWAKPSTGRVFVHSRGNAQHGYDFDRSAPPNVLEDAVRKAGGEVVVAPFSDIAAAGQTQQVMQEPTWRETVDLLLTCDACVTVDTGLAHVAGSLGIPMLLAVPTIPEWRWGNPERYETPWYPTAEVVRRSRTDRWHEVTDLIEPFIRGACASA